MTTEKERKNKKPIIAKRKLGENVMTKKEIAKQKKSVLAKRVYGKDK